VLHDRSVLPLRSVLERASPKAPLRPPPFAFLDYIPDKPRPFRPGRFASTRESFPTMVRYAGQIAFVAPRPECYLEKDLRSCRAIAAEIRPRHRARNSFLLPDGERLICPRRWLRCELGAPESVFPPQVG